MWWSVARQGRHDGERKGQGVYGVGGESGQMLVQAVRRDWIVEELMRKTCGLTSFVLVEKSFRC